MHSFLSADKKIQDIIKYVRQSSCSVRIFQKLVKIQEIGYGSVFLHETNCVTQKAVLM